VQDDSAAEQAQLVPIDEASRVLGLRASAIRYYEQRGLVQPAARRAGRRWYGPDQLRQLAIIRYWQQSAMMSLDQIADMLAGPSSGRRWNEAIEEHIDTLDQQIEQMQTARGHLEHLLSHHRDSSPDGCPHYETLIWHPEHNGRHPGHRHTEATNAVR
jgi:DNA-binding transcriptional MerR regulator